MRGWKRQLAIGCLCQLLLGGSAWAAAGDPTFSSSHYQVIESQTGGNGDFNSQSSNYSFRPGTDDGGSTLGDTAVGNSSSSSYQTNSGFNTSAQPGLTLAVNTSSINLSTLSTSAAQFATATFDVSDYTSYGYVVQVIGSPPVNSGHSLTALTTDTASSAGSEQFGLNTVRNTVAGQGANPVQLPSSTFSFGVAGDGTHNFYTQSDKYRFNSGEVVASAPKTSGDTQYTLTFMANISNLTPGGAYNGGLSIVATGRY